MGGKGRIGAFRFLMSEQPFLSIMEGWIEVRDGDDTARSLFDRHYSRYRYVDGRKPKIFVGPGEKMVLLSSDARALCVGRKFIRSEERRVGKECVSSCRSRCSPDH